MSETLTDEAFLRELEPIADVLYNRHLSTTKEWFPHELIPYGRGRDFEDGYKWTTDDSPFESEEVHSALLVNLLTEDNLPYYFRTIERVFGPDNAWGAWVRRWTAEEGRHSMAMYNYMMVSRAIDPVVLEKGRMAQVSKGQIPEPASARRGTIYVTLQELATRISHYNTGRAMRDEDEAGKKVMDRVGKDENFHMLFYRDLGSAAIQLDASGFVEDLEAEVTTFDMPGTGIPGFTEHAKKIARAGIYSFTEFKEGVVDPTLRHWKIWELEGLSSSAEAARERLSVFLGKLGRIVEREKQSRAKRQSVSQALA